MVTSFDVPMSQRREMNEKIINHSILALNNSSSQIPSRFLDETPSLQSKKSSNTFKSSNPFLSPNLSSSSSITDDESGTSSGQDEFHLERYSQDTQSHYQKAGAADRKVLNRKRSKRSRDENEEKTRPDLNVVTDFSKDAKVSHTTDMSLDEVYARRPDIARRTGMSIISAKAEHIGQISPQRNNTPMDFPKMLESAWNRRQKLEIYEKSVPKADQRTRSQSVEDQKATPPPIRSKEAQQIGKQNYPWPLSKRSEQPTTNNRKNKASLSDRSIVIGISVPEHELEAHRAATRNGDAFPIHAPSTPSIVVTSAAESVSWKPQEFDPRRRPASSVYSVWTGWDGEDAVHEDAPPLPQLPNEHKTMHQEHNIINPRPNGSNHRVGGDKDSDEGSEAEVERERYQTRRRLSSESTEQILASATETGRAKSQGWWNLMLSPMLSRAGTLKKFGRNAHERPPVPVLDQQKWQNRSPETEISPETPKRLGLANVSPDNQSRWDFWEKSRGKADQSVDHANKLMEQAGALMQKAGELAQVNLKGQDNQVSGLGVPAIIAPTSLDHGLAAEYYHACAVEQLTGAIYFECQNHSCIEKLPGLKSIFDVKETPYPSEHSRTADRTMDMPSSTSCKPDPDHSRTLSDQTEFDSEPDELSPNVREASTAAVMRAKALNARKSSTRVTETNDTRDIEESPQPEVVQSTNTTKSQGSSPPQTERQYPNVATVLTSREIKPSIVSPGPVSPEMQRTMTSQGAVQMSEVNRLPQAEIRPANVHHYVNHYYAPSEADMPVPRDPVQSQNPEAKPYLAARVEETREQPQKPEEPKKSKIKSVLGLLKHFIKKPTTVAASNGNPTNKRVPILIGTGLSLVVITCLVLAMTLTRSGDQTPTQNSFLNLTGYPPMPTGISTIIRPDPVRQQAQCVQPNTLWSCAAPKEIQSEITPNNPDQPNFRFEIKFRNGTVPSNMTIPLGTSSSNSSISKRSQGHSKRAHDPFTNDLFDPNPAPPSHADQLFMGNTTDNVTQPFDGEETPFFMTFIPAFPIIPSSSNESSSLSSARRLLARQDTNLSAAIPKPDVLSDGTAAPANVLPTAPYPTSQPVRLYNRGQPDEHYGFYMYYDKAIFSSSTAVLNSSFGTGDGDGDPADDNGGALRNQAKARCTFSQTRFLVRIWTSPKFDGQLLGSSTPKNGTKNTNSATNFTPPGSFPYPTTISLDRHGGNVNSKAVYCYGMDESQVIQQDVKSLVAENRGFGGALINPAPSLVNIDGEDNNFDQNAGGIDGGTGGCECVWQNWA